MRKGWREGSSRREKRSTDSQGKDPKTFQENSQGRDPSTLEINSKGEDPRTFEENRSTFKDRGHQAKRWRVQEKQKKGRWKKKKRKKMKKKKKAKHRKRRWWTKCKESFASLFTLRKKEDGKK